MEVEVLATMFGVALAAIVAACGAGFRWLRSDFHDLRVDFRDLESRFNEQTMVTNASFAEVNGRLDRLETRFDGLEHKVDRLEGKVDRLEDRFDVLVGKVDDLITVLARTGLPIEPRLAAPESPHAPESPPVPESTAAPPPASETAAQSPGPAPGPTVAPGDESLQAAPPSEITDLARAPPATGGQPTAERPYWPPPPEPFGPTAGLPSRGWLNISDPRRRLPSRGWLNISDPRRRLPSPRLAEHLGSTAASAGLPRQPTCSGPATGFALARW